MHNTNIGEQEIDFVVNNFLIKEILNYLNNEV